MGSLISEAQEILGALRGEILHVPDLREIFKDWPVDANTNYKEIIPVVESAFDRLVRNPGLREKYRKANYARFVSLQTFMNQMRRYIENCDKEQSLRLCGTLPGMEAYKELRHGTAAVWTLCALIEYGLGESFPEHIRCMNEMQTLWAETSRGIWITNDILSLKKEIPKDDRADESIVNAVPILMMEEGKSPQQAVDALLADLAISVATFEGAANTLAEAAGEGRQAVLRYCDACRCMVTGSIQFTFESTRYKLAGCMNADGSLDIPL
ncbi:Presilphiperfolan-8-beta-ol synthase [Colletotrichum sp. SAR 10_70]|nr:Presilphiperfolan-8-beta-ol synthase [Colletotrichum sp. SAR 10_71]KAI8167668.1 Presilphiperfolan-8-beta-ol synthase [Colletotrichum sp. SAR 10_70]KAI8172819.1 Presilphiperfolan-8-beta-ol synthase [Colletotrichum sp. SAR 10_65]